MWIWVINPLHLTYPPPSPQAFSPFSVYDLPTTKIFFFRSSFEISLLCEFLVPGRSVISYHFGHIAWIWMACHAVLQMIRVMLSVSIFFFFFSLPLSLFTLFFSLMAVQGSYCLLLGGQKKKKKKNQHQQSLNYFYKHCLSPYLSGVVCGMLWCGNQNWRGYFGFLWRIGV